MEKDSLHYSHWRTGESRTYILKESDGGLGEIISSLNCPFDQTSLIFIQSRGNLFCPNCGESYPPGSHQENLVSVFAIKFEHLKFKPKDVAEKVAD
jgi:hypothetical protein